MTLAAICAGVSAIRAAIAGDIALAVALIALAACLDAIDGRVARVLGCESPLGEELDSLADVVNFGVAPVIVIFCDQLWQVPAPGWAAALAFVAACAFRLARFNVVARGPAAAAAPAGFTGVPAPAGALLALMPVALARALPDAAVPPWLPPLWLVLVAGLMASRLPTLSPKAIHGPAARRALAAGGLAVAAALAWAPWVTLLSLCVAYLATIPLTWAAKRPYRKD